MTSWTRLRNWARLLSEYAAAQLLIQVLAVLAGLWLVNLLPVREYALYAFALSIFTFLTVFSDLGVSSALLYYRREVRIANAPMAPYVRAAFALRRSLLAAGAVAGLAFLWLTGRERGFGMSELAATGAVLVMGVWFQVSASLGLLLLRLEGAYRDSYIAEASGNALRLLGVSLLWLISAPLAWLAMLTAAAGSLVCSKLAARRLWTIGGYEPVAMAAQDAVPTRAVVRYMLPTLPSAIYFSIQAPLTVWLSAHFAGTQSIAEVGALGRLGLIFSMLSGFIGAVLVPRLSAVTDSDHYLRRYLQFWVILAALGVVVVGLAGIVPGWFLFLLGDAYRELRDELLIVAATSVLGTWGGYVVAINNARGWVRRQPAALIVFVALQVALVALHDLSSTRGVLYFGLWSSLAGLMLQLLINSAGFLRPAWVIVRASPTPAVKQS